MSYSVQEQKLNTGNAWGELSGTAVDQSMAANFETAALDVLYFDMGALQVVWTGTDSTTGIFSVETSLDAVNWCLESGSALTVAEADCNQMYNVTSYGQRYVRIKWTVGDATAGTMNFRSVLKVRR